MKLFIKKKKKLILGQVAISIQFFKQLSKICLISNLDVTNHSKGAVILEATINNTTINNNN